MPRPAPHEYRASNRRYVRTAVSFQNLHHFATLKIPDVYFVILATRYDPLPPRDRETCAYAISLAFVADVGLQASRGVVVPEADSAVMCGGENVLGIGRKLNMLTKDMMVVVVRGWIRWTRSDQGRTRWRRGPPPESSSTDRCWYSIFDCEEVSDDGMSAKKKGWRQKGAYIRPSRAQETIREASLLKCTAVT